MTQHPHTHSLIYSFIQYLLTVYYMQGTILDTEDSAFKKKNRQGSHEASITVGETGMESNTQIIHVTKAEHNECYEEKKTLRTQRTPRSLFGASLVA